MTALATQLRRMNACSDAIEWVGTRTDARRAWLACPRGDWLLWYAGRVGVDRELLVLAACDCARLALKHVPRGERRPLHAIETAERWCRGKATIAEVRAAYAAAYAAAAYAAAAAAAASAAAAAYAADARTATHQRCAELVRARIPWAALKGGES